MEKKHYSKPLMAAERFEPQEYCAVCTEGETVLVSECADDKIHRIIFKLDAGSTTEGNGGEQGSGSSNGHLFKTSHGYWAYAGRLEDGHYPDHYPMHQGEWMNITAGTPSTVKVGDWYNEGQGVKYCDCVFASGTPSQHHHLVEKSLAPTAS